MIAYYGQMQFTSLQQGLQGQLLQMVAQQFSAPLYLGDYVVAEGQGKLIIGDRGYDINAYDLEDGNLTIRASNLLAFQPNLSLNQSIVPGFLTLIGTGKFLASSNGPVMFVEPPVRVDPEALVGWSDCPSPEPSLRPGVGQQLHRGRRPAVRHQLRRGAAVRLHRCRNGSGAVQREGARRFVGPAHHPGPAPPRPLGAGPAADQPADQPAAHAASGLRQTDTTTAPQIRMDLRRSWSVSVARLRSLQVRGAGGPSLLPSGARSGRPVSAPFRCEERSDEPRRATPRPSPPRLSQRGGFGE